MSGDQETPTPHNQPPDLDAIEARLHAGTLSLARLNHVQNVNFARLNIAAALDDSEALVAEVRRLRAAVERVEMLAEDGMLTDCECGHGLYEHNGLGCYARLSYTPLTTCACTLTDDRTHGDLALLNLRAILHEQT